MKYKHIPFNKKNSTHLTLVLETTSEFVLVRSYYFVKYSAPLKGNANS